MKLRGNNKKAPISYSILSNTIVLVLIGVFLLLFFHINGITEIAKEKVNVIVELTSESGDSELKAVTAALNKHSSVLPGSVSHVPKSEAPAIMGITDEKLAQNTMKAFRDLIIFNVKSTDYNEESLATLSTEIEKLKGVDDVYYENVLIDNIRTNLRNLSFGIFILAIAFIVLAVIIIYNTVNLSLYSDRWEVKTMEIIGAKDSFIRQPYIKMAGRIALVSFLYSSAFLSAIIIYFWTYVPAAQGIINWLLVGVTFICMLVLSLAIITGATVRIVNKFLYKDADDLWD